MVHQGYINHVGLVLDASGSMNRLKSSTVQVADLQIKDLAVRSQEMDQETRATVYQFGNEVECLFYDKDVLRLPSIKGLYTIRGMTALIDATLKAIHDLQKTATLYGDHAFLLYILTDGLENASLSTRQDLQHTLRGLPDNWTLAVFVPDQVGVHEAKKLGFAPGNIAVWNPTEQGIREVGETIKRTTSSYMTARTQGIRSTTGLFNLETQNLTPATVNATLLPVPRDRVRFLSVRYQQTIREFVQSHGIPYKIGDSFYQLTKPETVQAAKQIMIRDRNTGYIYSGHDARSLLGLPNYEVRVAPADHPNYTIYVQSTSVNRKLVPGTELLVITR